MTATSSPRRDQRRGARYRQRLPVELHTTAGMKALFTHDVGLNGLFLLMKDPPRERHVLKLTVHLPDGPVGVIAHGTHTSPRGMGVQFFALSGDAKRRWNAFLGELAGAPESGAPDAAFGSATFVVKLHSAEAMREFAASCFDAGGSYLRTPVLKAVGAAVTITMIHPETEKEFPLAGTVVRLHQQRPKGMAIQFNAATLARRPAFARFVDTGAAPLVEIDLDAEADLVVGEERAAVDDAPFDLDIDVDVLDDKEVVEVELEKEETFTWHEVEDDLLLDTGIGDAAEEFEPVRTRPDLYFEGPMPLSQEGEPLPPGFSDSPAPFTVRLSCGSCDMLETEIDAGRAPGALGLVAEHKPFYCTSCRVVLTRRRLLSAGARREAEERARAAGALELPLALRTIFAVAELSMPPRCPSCDEKLRVTKPMQRLERALARLERGEDASEIHVPCALCKEGQWAVERVEPPLKV